MTVPTPQEVLDASRAALEDMGLGDRYETFAEAFIEAYGQGLADATERDLAAPPAAHMLDALLRRFDGRDPVSDEEIDAVAHEMLATLSPGEIDAVIAEISREVGL